MKSSLLKSAPLAWAVMLLIAIALICSFQLRTSWWAFIDIFFFFLMAFCHAVACSFARLNPAASRKLDMIAFVSGVLAVVALIAEWIVYSCVV